VPGTPLGRTAEQNFWLARAAVSTATIAIDGLAPPDSVPALKIRGLRLDVAALARRRARPEVTAEASGVVTGVFLRPGQEAAAGQRLMLIDHRALLGAVVTLTPQQRSSFAVGERLVFDFQGQRVSAPIKALVGQELWAELPNPDGKLQPGALQVHLRQAPRSLLELVLGR
jgi:multidrug efflux pump subunit AcrA (membrane-fusion protein)